MIDVGGVVDPFDQRVVAGLVADENELGAGERTRFCSSRILVRTKILFAGRLIRAVGPFVTKHLVQTTFTIDRDGCSAGLRFG